MGKPFISQDDLIDSLRESGLKEGETVLVSSDISLIGRFKGTLKDQLESIYSALRLVVGENGTIVAPAFFHEYSRNKIPFDVQNSPVSTDLGLFPMYIKKMSKVVCSLNPITSLAAVGPQAEYICGGETASAYGIDSGFDRLTKADAKMVYIGVDLAAMTYVHYVEHMVGVPHLYNKYYETPVYKNGVEIDFPVSAQVRYLDPQVRQGSAKNTEKFENAGLVKKVEIGDGYIRTLTFQEVFEFLRLKLQKDFFYLLESKPDFTEDKFPLL